MAQERVQIKNLVKGTVVINDPNIPIRREWTKKGQVNSIPYDVMEDLVYQEGIMTLFKDGILSIEDKDVRVRLGLEASDGHDAIVIFNENQMLGALMGKPADLEVALKKLPKEQINELVELAVTKEVTDMQKVDLIKKYTGRDILQLVKYNRQANEPDRIEN